MDETQREISDNRAVSLQQWNALHSKTNAFPPEILSLIFQNVCHPPLGGLDMHGLPQVFFFSRGSHYFPTLFGSVSHTWRQVAWSTPQLWTTLSITIPGSNENKAKNLASVIDLFFTNVRDLSITLHIAFYEHHLETPEYTPIAQVFFKEENLRKLGNLQLISPPDSWLCRLVGPFPRLVSINIFISDSTELSSATGYPFLPNAPMLREITLEYVDAPIPKAPWPMITVLKLGLIPAAVALQFLLGCPNLVQFYFIPDSDEEDEEEEEEEEELPDVPDTFTLHHLETLSSSFCHSSHLFLHRLRLPALRSLTWDQHQCSGTDVIPPQIWTFVQNLSGAPLTTIRLLGVNNIDINFIKHVYHHTPTIEEILLWHCHEVALCVMLRSLCLEKDDEGSVDRQPYLTKLKKLEFQSCRTISVHGTLVVHVLETFGDLVADLLIERARVDFNSSLCINLAFDIGTRIRWTPHTKERLRQLSRAGAKVQLLKNGKRVDWL